MGKIDKAPEQEDREHLDRDALSGTGPDSSEEFLEEPITTRFSFEIRLGLAILGVLGFILAAVVAYRLMTLRPSETATASHSDQPAATGTEKNTGGATQGAGSAGAQAVQPSPSHPQSEPNGPAGGPTGGLNAPSQPGSPADASLAAGTVSAQNDRDRNIDAGGASQVSDSETVWPVVPPLNLNNDPVNSSDGSAAREESDSAPLGASIGSAALNSGYHALEPNQPVATEQFQAVPPLPFGQPDNTAPNRPNEGSGLPDQGFTAGWNPSGPDQNAQVMANNPLPATNSSALSGVGSLAHDADGQPPSAASSLNDTPVSSGRAEFGTRSPSVAGSVPGDFFAGAPPLSNQPATGIPPNSAEASHSGQPPSQWPVNPSPPFGSHTGQNVEGLIPAPPSQLPLAGTGTPATVSSSAPPTVPPARSGSPTPAASSGMPYSPPLVADRNNLTPPFSENSTVNRRTYMVQEGETLFDIARQQLGKASRWVEIYQLNRERLGDKLENFRPGMTLLLPEDAVSAQAAGNILRQ